MVGSTPDDSRPVANASARAAVLVALNEKVQINKQDPDAVAKDWLASAGIS